MALYTIDEITFDRFHEKSDRIYRIVQHQDSEEEGQQYFGAVSFNAGLSARTEIPGVENSTRIMMWGRAVLRNQETQKAFYQPFITAENTFYQIFDYPLISGDKFTALSEPNCVVLSAKLAKKTFW